MIYCIVKDPVDYGTAPKSRFQMGVSSARNKSSYTYDVVLPNIIHPRFMTPKNNEPSTQHPHHHHGLSQSKASRQHTLHPRSVLQQGPLQPTRTCFVPAGFDNPGQATATTAHLVNPTRRTGSTTIWVAELAPKAGGANKRKHVACSVELGDRPREPPTEATTHYVRLTGQLIKLPAEYESSRTSQRGFTDFTATLGRCS
ncbi:hypothetical protein B0J13DRAFT_602836 [Dactylonectria estremocensis]|uniref:Uncharacterized protein n=1 Tax=Dactylonectria estremocensis TaxID=1079267 RepID=A0A9P9JCH1_9HYPO|nr:hypothetical protein B0J13DRAFT_602836 [Dactylonectria estremocensis]